MGLRAKGEKVTVYVLVQSEGEYSDYSEWRCGVFSTREAAHAYAKLNGRSRYSNGYWVEEWILDNPDAGSPSHGYIEDIPVTREY